MRFYSSYSRIITITLVSIIMALTVLLTGCSIENQTAVNDNLEIISTGNEVIEAPHNSGIENQTAVNDNSDKIPAGNEVTEASRNKCGDNVYWALSDGVLSISGNGDMYDFTVTAAATWEGTAPWFDNRAEISEVIVYDGVTSIGNEAFRGFLKLERVSIPDSLIRIGNSAFKACSINNNSIYYFFCTVNMIT